MAAYRRRFALELAAAVVGLLGASACAPEAAAPASSPAYGPPEPPVPSASAVAMAPQDTPSLTAAPKALAAAAPAAQPGGGPAPGPAPDPNDPRAQRERELGISWRDFRSEDAGFAVRLPGPIQFDQGPAAGGLSVTAHTDPWLFSAKQFPLDAERGRQPERTLDAQRDATLASVKATLLSETKVKLGDVPGREIRARTSDGVLTRFRVFVAPSRSYLLIVLMDPKSYDDGEIDVFFGSFQLIAPTR